MTGITGKIRSKQRILLAGCVCAAGIGSIGAVKMFLGRVRPQDKPEARQVFKSNVSTPASQLDMKEIWMDKFRQEKETQDQKMELMNKKFEQQTKLLETLMKLNSGSEASEVSPPLPPPPPAPEPPAPPSPAAMFLAAPQVNAPSMRRARKIQKIRFNLVNGRAGSPLRTPDNYIPAGTVCEGVILAGAAADTSVQASGNPYPVIIQLTGYGRMPRGFRSDLEGSVITAAAYGQLNSERAIVRFERMAFIERKTGEIIEIPVKGGIYGEDGEYGIRGVKIDRAGEAMRNALAGGLLSGIGQAFSMSRSPVTFSPVNGLAQTDPLSVAQTVGQGAGRGVGNAFEKYADFYIKRAEQLQPILKIKPGRTVSVVFTEGVSLDGTQARAKIVSVNDMRRNEAVQTIKPQELQ